jgi:hypothetical protein
LWKKAFEKSDVCCLSSLFCLIILPTCPCPHTANKEIAKAIIKMLADSRCIYEKCAKEEDPQQNF